MKVISTPAARKGATPGLTRHSPAQKALRTAKWARIMTKWLITTQARGV